MAITNAMAVQEIQEGKLDDKLLAVLVDRLGGQVHITVEEVARLRGTVPGKDGKELVYHFHTDSVDVILFDRGQADPYITELRKHQEVLSADEMKARLREQGDHAKRD